MQEKIESLKAIVFFWGIPSSASRFVINISIKFGTQWPVATDKQHLANPFDRAIIL